MKRSFWIGGLVIILLVGGGFYTWHLPPVQDAILARSGVASLRERVGANPADWRAQYWYGRRLAENGNLSEAEVALRSSLGTRPDFQPALVELGKVLLAQKKVEEAFQFLRMVAGRDPKDVESRLMLAVLYRSQKAYSRAMETATEVLALEPENPRALYELGTAQASSQQYAAAEATLRKAVGREPRNVLALVGLSGVLRELGKVDEAEQWARKALTVAPDDQGALVTLASVQMRRSSPQARDEAFELLRRARQANPGSVSLVLMTAELQVNSGRWQEAVPNLLAVIQQTPENTRAYYLLSRAYQHLGRAKEAAQVAATFRKREEIDRMIQNLQNEVASDPDRASLRFKLGEAYVIGGRLDLAVGSYRSGLARDPKNSRARSRLVQLMKLAVEK